MILMTFPLSEGSVASWTSICHHFWSKTLKKRAKPPSRSLLIYGNRGPCGGKWADSRGYLGSKPVRLFEVSVKFFSQSEKSDQKSSLCYKRFTQESRSIVGRCYKRFTQDLTYSDTWNPLVFDTFSRFLTHFFRKDKAFFNSGFQKLVKKEIWERFSILGVVFHHQISSLFDQNRRFHHFLEVLTDLPLIWVPLPRFDLDFP